MNHRVEGSLNELVSSNWVMTVAQIQVRLGAVTTRSLYRPRSCSQHFICSDVHRGPHHTTLTCQLQLLIRWSKFNIPNSSLAISVHVVSTLFLRYLFFKRVVVVANASIIIPVFLSSAYHTKTATCSISCVDNGLVQRREIAHISLIN